MKRGTILVAAVALLALAAVAVAGDWEVKDDQRWCRDGRWNSDRETYCEVREITISARDEICVDGGANGGITVEGWDRDEIRIRVKVQTWARSDEDAEAIADNIEILTDGKVIRAEGPRHKRRNGWGVSYRLMVPHKSNLELEANNGGIEVADVEGEIYLDTTNGGIHLSNLAGDVKGGTTNGGLHVKLSGKKWKGEGLDVRSTNGGVDLEIPKGYSAELETGTVNGGIELSFPLTVQGRIGKSIRATLGDGGPRVRVKTTNGGVHIYRG